jgi:hypothetical protein
MTNNKIVKRLWIQVPEFGGFLVRHRNFLVFLFGALGILLRSWNLADPGSISRRSRVGDKRTHDPGARRTHGSLPQPSHL